MFRLFNYQVRLGNSTSNGTNPNCSKLLDGDQMVYCNSIGRYLELSMVGSSKFVIICEVQAFTLFSNSTEYTLSHPQYYQYWSATSPSFYTQKINIDTAKQSHYLSGERVAEAAVASNPPSSGVYSSKLSIGHSSSASDLEVFEALLYDSDLADFDVKRLYVEQREFYVTSQQ